MNHLRSFMNRPKNKMSEVLQQDRSEFNVLYVHSELDDYGLMANEFRIYAHLARRAGKDGAWPSVDSMAEKCRLNRDTVYRCLKRLKELNLVRAIVRPGTTNIYVLTARSQWKENQKVSENRGYPPVSDTSTYRKAGDTSHWKRRDTQVSEKEGYEGTPREGNPFKEYTVGGGADGRNVAPSSLVPNGRRPDGHPAMSRHHRQVSRTGNADGDFVQIHVKPSQTPIQRKAYAIADLLRFRHWDNCKVSFAKHTARAYAETALQDGHDEQAVLKAYNTALLYCHGVTTDKICRGERFPHEKASPALTVWLARERLKGDPRTVEERWKIILARLTTEQRKAIEEEARIQQEVAEKTPEIEAWFANKLKQGTTGIDLQPSLEAEPQTVPV